MAQVIAFALEVDPVDLFGDPQAEENYIPSEVVGNFDTYRRAVASAMRALGMNTFGDLYKKIKEIMYRPDMQGILGDTPLSYNYIHQTISAGNKSRNSRVFTRDGEFGTLALIIAVALETSPHILFGDPPEKPSLHASLSDHMNDLVTPAEVEEFDEDFWGVWERAIGQLSEQEEYVLRCLYSGENPPTYAQLADELDINTPNIKMMVHRAKKKLARTPEAEYLLRLLDVTPERRVFEGSTPPFSSLSLE